MRPTRRLSLQPLEARDVPTGSPGTADTAFGTGGAAVVSHGELGESVAGSAVAAGGKVVLAVNVATGLGNRVVVSRLNADGSPDTTFGAPDPGDPTGESRTGSVVVWPEEFNVEAAGVAISGKKVVVAGTQTIHSGRRYFTAARLTGRGDFDQAYGFEGRAGFLTGLNIAGATNLDAAVTAVAARSGKTYLAGTLDTADQTLVVARLGKTGRFDLSFGDYRDNTDPSSGRRGYRTLREFAVDLSPTCLAVQGSKLVFGGSRTLSNGDTDPLVGRMHPNGNLDVRFGRGDAYVVYGIDLVPGGRDVVTGLASQGGNVVAAIDAESPDGGSQAVVLRLDRYGLRTLYDETTGDSWLRIPNLSAPRVAVVGGDIHVGGTRDGDFAVVKLEFPYPNGAINVRLDAGFNEGAGAATAGFNLGGTGEDRLADLLPWKRRLLLVGEAATDDGDDVGLARLFA